MLAGARPSGFMPPPCILTSTPDAPRQARLHHGRQRRDRDLPPARRAIQPHRAAFPLAGAPAGDHIALFLENNPRFFEICWGAQRSGLFYTAISSRLTAGRGRVHRRRLRRQAVRHLEVPCRHGGRAARRCCQGVDEPLHDRRHDRRLRVVRGRRSRACPQRRSPTRPRATTCSIRRAPPAGPRACCRCVEPQADRLRQSAAGRSPASSTAWTTNTVYLSPAPLYHAAPLRFNMTRHAAGRHRR